MIDNCYDNILNDHKVIKTLETQNHFKLLKINYDKKIYLLLVIDLEYFTNIQITSMSVKFN